MQTYIVHLRQHTGVTEHSQNAVINEAALQ